MKKPTDKTLYGEAYYSGQTSGYPLEGYAAAHPDWKAWLDLIAALRPTGRFLDIGCAFGYLPAKARSLGYQAYGSDISSYALHQEPKFYSWLFQADAHRLPVAGQTIAVVTLFDVLEHLSDPVLCLEEAIRLLEPEGLLVGATPDPLFFFREEETHCYERPPSFWIDRLRQLGMEVCFRFSVEPYNFQFVAARRGSELSNKLKIFQHDYFSPAEEMVRCKGEVIILPRHGWGELRNGSREIVENPASLYLLNPVAEPRRLQLSLLAATSPHFSTLRIRFDSYVLRDLYLSSEKQVHEVEINDLLVPSGGHHLFFEIFPGGPEVFVTRIESVDEPASRLEITRGLPFDLFQRYQISVEILKVLKPQSALDVGGVIGDRDGHLAVSADFFGQVEGLGRISSTDLRHCDYPEHSPAPAHEQPYPDGSFNAVVCLDVLEHLPADTRRPFLAELDRVATDWIILGAPFDCSEVVAAEGALQQLFQKQTFLHEHEEEGLPDLKSVTDFYSEKGYSVYTIPNGYLPRWKQMQAWTQLYFSLANYQITRAFNSIYNEHCYQWDQQEPSYRKILLISKKALSPKIETGFRSPVSRASGGLEELAADSRFYHIVESAILQLEEQRRALSDAQFLASARQQGIDQMQREMNETSILQLIVRRWRRWREEN